MLNGQPDSQKQSTAGWPEGRMLSINGRSLFMCSLITWSKRLPVFWKGGFSRWETTHVMHSSHVKGKAEEIIINKLFRVKRRCQWVVDKKLLRMHWNFLSSYPILFPMFAFPISHVCIPCLPHRPQRSSYLGSVFRIHWWLLRNHWITLTALPSRSSLLGQVSRYP